VHGGGGARRHAELRASATYVRLHAGGGDPERESDLLRGAARGDSTHDLTLSSGEGIVLRAGREEAPREDKTEDDAGTERSQVPTAHTR